MPAVKWRPFYLGLNVSMQLLPLVHIYHCLQQIFFSIPEKHCVSQQIKKILPCLLCDMRTAMNVGFCLTYVKMK